MTDREGHPFRVRHYEPADRAALESMYGDFEPKRGAQGLPPVEPAAINRWLGAVLGRGQHLVVEVDGALLGHLMLVPMDDGKLELANFLHQSIRNRGIGTELSRMALLLARDAGASSVWLSVEPSNRAAVRSYQKAGFQRRPGSLWGREIEMEAALVPASGAGRPPALRGGLPGPARSS
jgi:ribosomal protein S18 acetylase RimI-like enzyme